MFQSTNTSKHALLIELRYTCGHLYHFTNSHIWEQGSCVTAPCSSQCIYCSKYSVYWPESQFSSWVWAKKVSHMATSNINVILTISCWPALSLLLLIDMLINTQTKSWGLFSPFLYSGVFFVPRCTHWVFLYSGVCTCVQNLHAPCQVWRVYKQRMTQVSL